MTHEADIYSIFVTRSVNETGENQKKTLHKNNLTSAAHATFQSPLLVKDCILRYYMLQVFIYISYTHIVQEPQ